MTVKFSLPALPQGKMLALRGMGSDVDYVGEGSFKLNGNGPYTVPVTGDSVVMEVTVPIKPEHLKVGENVLEFRHDNRASGAMSFTQIELLAGDQIIVGERW